MEKIRLDEFIRNFNTVLLYAMRHLVKEDWDEFDGSVLVADVFDTMQYYVTATQKCAEYLECFEEYDKMDKKSRGCVFLDVK